MDTVYPGFSKAFGTVSHSLLLEKQMCYDSGQVISVVGGELTDRATLWEDLDRLKEWARKNLKNFNKDKCEFLHMEKRSTGI